MRLAATLTPMRDATRQAVALRGTLRDPALTPHEVVIRDLSSSGFLAELPEGMELEPGTRVQVAATPIGIYEAIAIRRDEAGFGFSFTRPLAPVMLAAANGTQASNVAPFPAGPLPTGAAIVDAVVEERAPISARASLVIICGLAAGLWSLLAAALWASSSLG